MCRRPYLVLAHACAAAAGCGTHDLGPRALPESGLLSVRTLGSDRTGDPINHCGGMARHRGLASVGTHCRAYQGSNKISKEQCHAADPSCVSVFRALSSSCTFKEACESSCLNWCVAIG